VGDSGDGPAGGVVRRIARAVLRAATSAEAGCAVNLGTADAGGALTCEEQVMLDDVEASRLSSQVCVEYLSASLI